MAKKKAVKKVIKKVVEKVVEKVTPTSKKEKIGSALLAVIKKLQPELNRRFDIYKIVPRDGTKGLLRDYLKDFEPEDRYTYRDILAELKDKKVLYHIGNKWWTRLK